MLTLLGDIAMAMTITGHSNTFTFYGIPTFIAIILVLSHYLIMDSSTILFTKGMEVDVVINH